MTKETDTIVPGSLENAYPPAQPAGTPPAPVKNAELDALKVTMEDMKTKLSGLEDENGELKKKLADVEHEKLVALAGQVADIKVSRGLLTEDKKGVEIEELSKLSAETLEILHKELSNIKVKLSENPAPLSTPAPNPVTPSPEDQRAAAEVAERQKLFGHENSPVEFYTKLRDEGEL